MFQSNFLELRKEKADFITAINKTYCHRNESQVRFEISPICKLRMYYSKHLKHIKRPIRTYFFPSCPLRYRSEISIGGLILEQYA